MPDAVPPEKSGVGIVSREDLPSDFEIRIDSALKSLPTVVRQRCNRDAIFAALHKIGVVEEQQLLALLVADYQEIKDALKGAAPPTFLSMLHHEAQKKSTIKGRVLRAIEARGCRGVWSLIVDGDLPDPKHSDLVDKMNGSLNVSLNQASYVLITLGALRNAGSNVAATMESNSTKAGPLQLDPKHAKEVDTMLRTVALSLVVVAVMTALMLRASFGSCVSDHEASHLMITTPRWVLELPGRSVKFSILVLAAIWTMIVLEEERSIAVFIVHQLFIWGSAVLMPIVVAHLLGSAKLRQPENKVAPL